jgi:chaperonin GroEL
MAKPKKANKLDHKIRPNNAAHGEADMPPNAGKMSGGMCSDMNHTDKIDTIKNDISKGAAIVFTACGAPFKQILDNAGVNHNDILMDLRSLPNTMVPNIAEETLVDAFEVGIIDPTKVVRCALQNAAAAAVTLLMTECVIHNKPTDKKNDNGVGMDMMGGMM